jgi:hypothetical protein
MNRKKAVRVIKTGDRDLRVVSSVVNKSRVFLYYYTPLRSKKSVSTR